MRLRPFVIPDANELVPRSWVIAFIADRWLPLLPADTVREARDKVGGQMRTAIGREKLKSRGNGKFVFGEVIAWAGQKSKWRGDIFWPEALEPADLRPQAKGEILL